MKIDKYLLTEKDIENIKLREKIDSEIQEKIQIEYDRITNECMEKYDDINYEELKKSDSLKYYLVRKYYNNKDNSPFIIIGSMLFFTPTITLFSRYINSKFTFETHEIIVFLGMYLASLLIIWFGINEIIERRKIKKNFKSLGIGDEL